MARPQVNALPAHIRPHRLFNRMMRNLIVDDESIACARLAALLGDYASISLVGSAGDGVSAIVAIGHLVDVLWLDIHTPGLNRTALAQRLAGQARPPSTFCTAYEAHALQAFKLRAIDYLLEPVRIERLRDALQRAERRHLPDRRPKVRRRTAS